MATTSSYTDPTVVSSTANENRIRTPLEERERKERACWQVVIFICDFALPPLGVFLQAGVTDVKFWVTILLTIIGWIPGIIFALFVFFTSPREPINPFRTDAQARAARSQANSQLPVGVKASDPAAQHEMTDLPAGSTAYVSDAGVADHNPYVKSGPGAV